LGDFDSVKKIKITQGFFYALILVSFVWMNQSDTVMQNYDPKILLAFGETFEPEGDEFYTWLLENGYPELAALSSGIRGSREAIQWLLQYKYPHFAALDGAIDNKPQAYEWLNKHDFPLLIMLAEAVHGKPQALAWFKNNNLEIFLRIAQKIRHFMGDQTFDYHKLHF
jgi:hypothetical protein